MRCFWNHRTDCRYTVLLIYFFMLCCALETWPRVVGRLHIGPKMTGNGPKSSVLEFNQNRVINIGWNLFQMIYIVLYHPVQIRYLENYKMGPFGLK